MSRLRRALGGGPRLLVKRDDAIPFGFGGNKVRKLALVAAQALAAGADTLLTTGGVQSNHCRATAAAAARLGLGCHLVVNGQPPARATPTPCSTHSSAPPSSTSRTARRARPPSSGPRPDCGRGAPTLRDPARRLHAPGGPGLRSRPGRARRPGRAPRRDHPRQLVGGDAGRAPGRRRPARPRTRASSGSAPTSRRRPWPARWTSWPRPRWPCSEPPPGGLSGADSPAGLALRAAEVDDRFGGGGLRHPDRGLARGRGPRGPPRSAGGGPHLYRQGAGRCPRRGAGGGVRPRHETVLFWHTGGQVGVFA